MWTDEQLRSQGWTDEQIATRREEQAAESAPAPTELPVENTSIPMVEESIEDVSGPFVEPGMTVSMPAIILVAMLLLVPFSLYSISNAEGIEGPSGKDGMNGADGSSFHLVVSPEDLRECNDDLNNQIFFIASESIFQVCQNNTWKEINLTGKPGLDGLNGTNGLDGLHGQDGLNGQDGANGQTGMDGADGADGQNGTDGADGSDGADGNNGFTSLILTRNEPSGANCPNGGTLVETGIDTDNDNVLSPSEVNSIVFVCNGDTGQDGVNGSSAPSMLVARLSIAPSYLGCNATGELLEQGMDNGAGNGIALNGILEPGEVISRTLICTTFEVSQVQDINPTGNSDPSNFATINSTMYFTANNGSTSGIWSMDVNGNISLEYSGTAMSMRAIGSQLMFLGATPAFDLEPFVYEPSNGTAWQAADIFPGTGSSYAGEFTLIGTTVFFSARDSAGSTGIGRYDLWAYETGNSSVWKVEPDIQPRELTVVNSNLYFSAEETGGTGIELWKHDTSNNSTFVVKDIKPGLLSSSPEHLVSMGTTIYMSADDGSGGGVELQAYDTTNNSTWQVADIRPGSASSMISDTVVIGTRVYMTATSGTHFELWVYESQNNSLWEVSNFQTTSASNGPAGLTVHEYTVYFSADDGTTGEELWAHNSINGTTWQVIDLKPTGGTIGDIHVHGGNVYFSGEDNWDGRELWRLIFSKDVSFV